jgi:hypothetical protein
MRHLRTSGTADSIASSGKCKSASVKIRLVRLIALCTLLVTSGCKYDGSFFQMSSDSPAPFFGLQLSVRHDRSDNDFLKRRDLIRHVRGGSHIGTRQESQTIPEIGSVIHLQEPPR